MALGLLIAAAISAVLAAIMWHDTNTKADTFAGRFGGMAVFVGLVVLTAILLVAAATAWVVSLF